MSSTNPSKSTLQSVADEIPLETHTLREQDQAAAVEMLPGDPETSQKICRSCNKDVSECCFIRCVECTATDDDEAMDLCVKCFASGREPLDHLKSHAYRVMDKLSHKMFDERWTARQELALVDQVQAHGLASWDVIAQSRVFGRKTASEVRNHYLDTYLCRYGSVLPPFYLDQRPDGTVERVPIPLTGPEPHDSRLNGVEVNARELRGQTIAELGTDPRFRYEPSWEVSAKKGLTRNARGVPASANTGATGSRRASTAATAGVEARSAADRDGAAGKGGGSSKVDKRQKRKKEDGRNETDAIREWVKTLPGGDIEGYMPLRGDFDMEPDDDAEQLLADLEFNASDDEGERQLKLDVVAIYNRRVDDRERRKRFVVEHCLPRSGNGAKNEPVAAKKRRKEDAALVAKLEPFAKFHSTEEHDDLIDNLLLAKKMRVRIAQLKEYQAMGLTTLALAHEHETAKRRKREAAQANESRKSGTWKTGTWKTGT